MDSKFYDPHPHIRMSVPFTIHHLEYSSTDLVGVKNFGSGGAKQEKIVAGGQPVEDGQILFLSGFRCCERRFDLNLRCCERRFQFGRSEVSA